MLTEIREGGEEACKGFAKKLDNYSGPILLTDEDIEEQTKDIADQVTALKDIAYYRFTIQDKADIDFLVEQVSMFAKVTRDKITDWEVDLGDGSVGGTKYVSVTCEVCLLCYFIPGLFP